MSAITPLPFPWLKRVLEPRQLVARSGDGPAAQPTDGRTSRAYFVNIYAGGGDYNANPWRIGEFHFFHGPVYYQRDGQSSRYVDRERNRCIFRLGSIGTKGSLWPPQLGVQ